MATTPRRLLIVGAGLIGTSIARASRRGWPGAHVTGIDDARVWATHPRTGFDDALEHGAPLPACDVIVLACPVSAMPGWLARLARDAPSTTVTDVGGVKVALAQAAALARHTRFVGGHPMAGASCPGPSHASDALFEGQTWFVVRGTAPIESVTMVRDLATACGARPVDIDAERHDAIVAAISHLPQVVASALMTCAASAAGPVALTYAGNGLRDTTRLAESPPDAWLPVLAANRDQIAPLLLDLAARLRAIADTLGDRDAMTRLFAEASRARHLLVTPTTHAGESL